MPKSDFASKPNVLAIDYGKKRVGLAAGRIFPKGLGTLDGDLSHFELVRQIKAICDREEIDRIVIGYPIRSQGEDGTLAGEINKFADLAADATGIPVEKEPEQFTSVAAQAELERCKKEYKKGDIDELSAVLLLEQYLNNAK